MCHRPLWVAYTSHLLGRRGTAKHVLPPEPLHLPALALQHPKGSTSKTPRGPPALLPPEPSPLCALVAAKRPSPSLCSQHSQLPAKPPWPAPPQPASSFGHPHRLPLRHACPLPTLQGPPALPWTLHTARYRPQPSLSASAMAGASLPFCLLVSDVFRQRLVQRDTQQMLYNAG